MKKSAMIFTIIITILVTASVVWALTSIPISSPSGKNEISEEMQALQTTNQELLEQTKELTDERNLLQARLEEIDESKDEITRQPKSGWNQYFPEHNTTTLEGETTATVQELLGVPAIKIRSTAFSTEFNREIWIFMPS